MANFEGLPLDAVLQVRHPTEVFTDAYLEDSIKFDPDDRFDPMSATPQVYSVPVVTRDLGDYLLIDLNAKSDLVFPIATYSRVISRSDFLRVIDTEFRSFGVRDNAEPA
jgi:hypothetical protein